MNNKAHALREAIAHALELEFGQFLEHDPFSPARFYGQAADAIMRLLPVERKDGS